MSSSQKQELPGKRIIVTGAGLAGLAFACAIDQYWPVQDPRPQVVIYERSAKELDRSHAGYTMGIRAESGLLALKQLGLLDNALQASTVGANGADKAPTFWSSDWKTMFDPSSFAMFNEFEDGMPKSGIRLVRYVLRDMLLNALSVGTEVHWGNGCQTTRILPDGRTQIELSNGSTDEADLLVAADGSNSKVRTMLLPEEKLEYTGAVCFLGTSRFPDGKPELLAHKWGMNISGKGVPFLTLYVLFNLGCLRNSLLIMCSPVDSHTGVWGISYRPEKPRNRIKGKEAMERRDEILDEVRTRGKMFHEPFNQFIDATDPETLQVFNAMHKYPLSHAQKLSHAKIALIGDANHPMSPFSGNGANMALMDGVSLAKQLAGHESVRTAIEEFDKESMPRSRKAIDKSKWVIPILHSEGLTYWLLRTLFAVLSSVLWVKSLW